MSLREEAERIGVSFPAMLTTDLARYRPRGFAATATDPALVAVAL